MLVTGGGSDPTKLKKLFAYSFHVYRSTCHKPVAAQIALIALFGFTCTLPALQKVLYAVSSLSNAGPPLLEYLHGPISRVR